MYLTRRHTAENALIQLMLERLAAANLINAIETLTGPYGNQIDYLTPLLSATALSITAEANKKNIANPISLFDEHKVVDFTMAVANMVANPQNLKLHAMPTLTTYSDVVRIHQNQMNYRNKRYHAHPLEKTLDTIQSNKGITNHQHLAYVLQKLDEHGVSYHLPEVEKEFEKESWNFIVPAVINDSDSRLSLNYYAYRGELTLENYDNSLNREAESPNLYNRVRERVISEVKVAINAQGDISLAKTMFIDLSMFMQHNSPDQHMHVNVTLPIAMLDHHLRPAVENLVCSADIIIDTKALDAYEQSGGARHLRAPIDTAIDKTLEALTNSVKGRGTKARRRSKNKKTSGDNAIMIDRVAQTMIMLVAKQDPDWAQNIVLGKRKHFNFKTSQNYVYLDDTAYGGRVGFKTFDGKMTTSFRMAPDQHWLGSGLMIPKVAEIIGESLMGCNADEVVDHPIAKLLGAVTKVTHRTRATFSRTTVNFANIYDPITREEMLTKILEPEKYAA